MPATFQVSGSRVWTEQLWSFSIVAESSGRHSSKATDYFPGMKLLYNHAGRSLQSPPVLGLDGGSEPESSAWPRAPLTDELVCLRGRGGSYKEHRGGRWQAKELRLFTAGVSSWQPHPRGVWAASLLTTWCWTDSPAALRLSFWIGSPAAFLGCT